MTPVAGVLGWPAQHSRSPLVHGYWLQQNGLTGGYLRLSVEPERLASVVRDLEGHGLVGANVTVPHKEAAFALADEVDDIGRALGAVNTLWLEGRRVHATNTDMHGFIANLDDRAPGWDQASGTALVLGAGGASRAVVLGLLRRGFERVVLANRTVSRAEAFAAQFGDRVKPVPLHDLNRYVPDSTLVVNTTSLGMKGEGKPDVDWTLGRPGVVATDVVYVPLMTPFLADAAAHGARIVDGLGMLLHQAVPGFERWFHVKPRVTAELRALIETDLAGAGP